METQDTTFFVTDFLRLLIAINNTPREVVLIAINNTPRELNKIPQYLKLAAAQPQPPAVVVQDDLETWLPRSQPLAVIGQEDSALEAHGHDVQDQKQLAWLHETCKALGLAPKQTTEVLIPRRGLWKNFALRARDSYGGGVSLPERLARASTEDKADTAWYPKHGAPRHGEHLLEDCTFLIRILHSGLPIDQVTEQPKVCRCVDCFVRRYGVKFADIVTSEKATLPSGRLSTNRALPLLQQWLGEMSGNGKQQFGPPPQARRKRCLNRFDWDGWYLSSQTELETLTSVAVMELARGLIAEEASV